MKTGSPNTKRIVLALGSISLALSATSLLAADTGYSGMAGSSTGLQSGLYMATDLGLNLADDLTVSSVGSVSLSPGVRWDLSTGYAFKLADQLTLAPEVEVGVIYNPLDKATAAGGPSASISGSYVQVPVMGNGIVNWQFSPHWVAYAGGGAGYDYMSLDVTSVGGASFSGTSNESDFAWQGLAGIRYAFGSSEVGLGYKYLAVKPSGMETIGNSTILLSFTVHF